MPFLVLVQMTTLEFDPSKLELEGELDRAGAADLVERAEAAIGATGAQTACKRLRRVAEEGVRQVVIGIAEIWMVKDVEELGSKTKPTPFSPGIES